MQYKQFHAYLRAQFMQHEVFPSKIILLKI